MKKKNIAICVYGSYDDRDIRIKIFDSDDNSVFKFQNILQEAGYDADLFWLEI